MKIESSKKTFSPVTLTLETPEELLWLHAVLCSDILQDGEPLEDAHEKTWPIIDRYLLGADAAHLIEKLDARVRDEERTTEE